MNIITSGYPYIDIDAYAAMVAYAELLNVRGIPSKAVSTAPFNESITPEIMSWKAPVETVYTPSSEDTFILVDISDPAFFEKFVNPARVTEVIDHHPSSGDYWHQKLGERAQIEFIGAAATLVYERWQAAKLVDKMSLVSARFLVAAILDNTLNFGAKVTSSRDHEAYDDLLKIADLSPGWTAQYFNDCQASILQDLATALTNDTKILSFKSFPKPIALGQLVVWDSRGIWKKYSVSIEKTLASQNRLWFLNLVNVSQKRSYFICQNPEVKQWLRQLLKIDFKDATAIAERLWLRKEIIKQDLEVSL